MAEFEKYSPDWYHLDSSDSATVASISSHVSFLFYYSDFRNPLLS